jgi:hypothetical protein
MCKWSNIDLQTRVQRLSPVGNGNFFHFQLVAKNIKKQKATETIKK